MSSTKSRKGLIFKLTLWMVVSIAAAFIAFIVISVGVLYSIVNAQLDHHVETVLNEAEVLWLKEPVGQNDLIQGLVASRGMVVVVLAPDGEVLLKTSSPEIDSSVVHKIKEHVATEQHDEHQSHIFTYKNMRLGVKFIGTKTPGEIIAVAYSFSPWLQAIRWYVASMVVLALLFIFGVGYFVHSLIRRSLMPITDVVNTVQNISTSGDLARRIPLTNRQDEVGMLIGVLNDMLSRLEQSLKAQQAFLSGAAHTIKTPLASMRTHLENLSSNGSDFSDVTTSIDRLSKVIDDMLYAVNVSSYKPKEEKVDLSGVVKDICELTSTLASAKGVKLQCKVKEGVFVKGDRNLLVRAILNIVENATYYTTKGEIEIVLDYEQKNVRLEVSDTGVGMSKEFLERAFERFSREESEANNNGTGLGLSITRDIIKAHGGEISIKSEKDVGTSVVIILPGAPS